MCKYQNCRWLLCLILCFLPAIGCKKSAPPETITNPPMSANPYNVTKNVTWVQVDGGNLSMDIYTPQTGKTKYPVLVIYHGGGWLINTNSTMDSMAVYIVQHGEYIVCNVNYRLLGDNNNSITMNQIVEDAMGALLWIKEHIASYGGDAARIVLTGDSAGGHLAAMVIVAGNNLESDGFAGSSYGFKPTYMPAGKTPETLAAENALDVQGGILSYAAFDIYSACFSGMETPANVFWFLAGKTPRGIFGNAINVIANPAPYKAVSPAYCIPQAVQRKLPPQFCLVGSKDNIVAPGAVQAYVSLLQAAGQSAEFWVYEGQPHAFLDAAPNPFLGTEFRRDAPPALDKMINFMNRLFAQ